ncbi:MAG: DMT family transporter [Casimicrobiaceae bacterium]
MELTTGITLAVLGAGFLHASWNALLKSSTGGDAMLDIAAVVAGSAFWAMLIVPFVPLPQSNAWLFMAASSVIHFGYYTTLARAYGIGDLSFAYPLMRGTAPLIVTVIGSLFLRELPSAAMMLGIGLISAGIISIAFVQRNKHPPSAARWAFANAAIVAAYTVVDGTGARAAGNAMAYVTWLLFLEGLPFLIWIGIRRGRSAVGYLRGNWRAGMVAGAFSFAAYAIVLWAMTRAPIAVIAALRETSVLFAALMGSLWLKEGFGWRRAAGAATVVAGIATLKLG